MKDIRSETPEERGQQARRQSSESAVPLALPSRGLFSLAVTSPMDPTTVLLPSIWTFVYDACELNPELKVAFTESAQGALLAAGATLAGGLLLGPIGLAVGGTLGGLAAYATSKNFTPASRVLSNMSEK